MTYDCDCLSVIGGTVVTEGLRNYNRLNSWQYCNGPKVKYICRCRSIQFIFTCIVLTPTIVVGFLKINIRFFGLRRPMFNSAFTWIPRLRSIYFSVARTDFTPLFDHRMAIFHFVFVTNNSIFLMRHKYLQRYWCPLFRLLRAYFLLE